MEQKENTLSHKGNKKNSLKIMPFFSNHITNNGIYFTISKKHALLFHPEYLRNENLTLTI